MSADPFDVRPDAESLAEAEDFVRTFADVKATYGAIYAEIVMARYTRLTAVAHAARALHGALAPNLVPEMAVLKAALDALDGNP